MYIYIHFFFQDTVKTQLEIDNENIPERAQWGNSIEFLMSCISLSVGLGNIWRFPFTAYENGGGAFLIPYIVVLFIIGKPMYYLEMTLGQFITGSAVKVWEVSPLLRGNYYSDCIVFRIYIYNILNQFRCWIWTNACCIQYCNILLWSNFLNAILFICFNKY